MSLRLKVKKVQFLLNKFRRSVIRQSTLVVDSPKVFPVNSCRFWIRLVCSERQVKRTKLLFVIFARKKGLLNVSTSLLRFVPKSSVLSVGDVMTFVSEAIATKDVTMTTKTGTTTKTKTRFTERKSFKFEFIFC